MKKQRRTHNSEFKREAVSLVTEHGYSCAAAGRSLGVNGTLIGRWKREIEAHTADAFPGNGKRTAEHSRWCTVLSVNFLMAEQVPSHPVILSKANLID